jgi:hypothetical protein
MPGTSKLPGISQTPVSAEPRLRLRTADPRKEQEMTKRISADEILIAAAAIYLVAGMVLGIAMGMTHDFRLRHMHAHVNLVGFAAQGMIGLTCRAWPELKTSALVQAAAWLILAGTPFLLFGMGAIAFGSWAAPIIPGSIAVAVGSLLFTCALVRNFTNAKPPAPEASVLR